MRIYGQDLAILRAKAAEGGEAGLAEIDGVVTDLHVEFLLDIPQVEIRVDLAKATEQYELKPGDVRRAAAYLVAGERSRRHIAQRRIGPTT